MTILIEIVLALAILWLVGWLGNLVFGLALFLLVAIFYLWDYLFPPGPPSNP